MRKLGIAPILCIGATLLTLVAPGPMARGQDAQPAGHGAWVGVVTRALTDAWRESKGYTASGVMVIEVAPGSPADQVGMSPGDIRSISRSMAGLLSPIGRTGKSQASCPCQWINPA